MHTLPLFYPAHVYLPPILSHPMYAFPLFYPTPCIPSPYSIPAHAYPPPILSQLMHTLPLFYPSLYTPSPYSIPFHPIHALPLFYPSVCMSSPVLYQPTHALLTPCHMNLEGMFLLWHLRMLLLNLLTLNISLSFTKLSNLKHQFMTPACLLFSFTWTHHIKLVYTLDPLLNYIYIT